MPTAMSPKQLEEIRGFLNYMVRTYPSLKPYLTGFHLTIDGWRADQDRDGWRRRLRPNKDNGTFPDEEDEVDGQSTGKLYQAQDQVASKLVESKVRLHSDIKAL